MKLHPNHIQVDILRRHSGPFVFCFLTIMFLLLMQFFIQFIDHLVGKDIPLLVIIELIMVNLAYMVVLAVPMTILAASLMAFGKFAEQNEFTAIKAAGIHPMRIITPVLAAAALMSVFLIWFSNYTLPEANYKARALFLDIRMKKPGFDLQENVFYDGIDGYTFLVREISSDTLKDVTLFQDQRNNRDRAIIKARRGYLKADEVTLSLSLELSEGSIIRYLPQSRSRTELVEETLFNRYLIRFDMSDLVFTRTNPEQRQRDGRTMSAQAMRAAVDSLRLAREKEFREFNNISRPMNLLSAAGASETASPEQSDLQKIIDDTGPGNVTEYLTYLHDPVPSRFATLGSLGSLDEQRDIAQKGLMNFRETFSQFDNLQNNVRWRTERIARFMVEIHKKIALPVACLIFVLIGAPLGLLTRKGNIGINALISTLLFTYYWVCIIQGEKLADRLFISPFVGMWFANITMLAAGLLLLLKVIRENRF